MHKNTAKDHILGQSLNQNGDEHSAPYVVKGRGGTKSRLFGWSPSQRSPLMSAAIPRNFTGNRQVLSAALWGGGGGHGRLHRGVKNCNRSQHLSEVRLSVLHLSNPQGCGTIPAHYSNRTSDNWGGGLLSSCICWGVIYCLGPPIHMFTLNISVCK